MMGVAALALNAARAQEPKPPVRLAIIGLVHIKPDVYPKVDDDATLGLTYPKAVGVIQASWNWPSSLAVNLVVTKILDAARESARTGRRINLPADR